MQVRNVELAQDITQEAFARVWASSRTPKAEIEFKRWLYRAISNLATDHYRREQRIARFASARASTPGPVDEFEQWVTSEVIMAALQRLSIRDRQLIYLRYFEDQPLSECARLLGLDPVSVRVLVRRALGRLRRELVSIDALPEVAPDVR
jgi:RNA polymerase sigma factor (sigma-70 family)